MFCGATTDAMTGIVAILRSVLGLLAVVSLLNLKPCLGQEYFEQKVDHFDHLNTKTWRQTYFVNDTFYSETDTDAPVFLCMGGEGPPLTPQVTVSSVHCNNAVEYAAHVGALVLALEHRYYTCHNMSACPVSSLKNVTSYRYFSLNQALEDAAQFHAYISEKFNLTRRNKWVTFGGSYPGILAAYARQRFPHLFYASVASSAPVEGIVDLQGYNDVVAAAYEDPLVGGSKECRKRIAEGHATIKHMLQSEQGRRSVEATFRLSSGYLDSEESQAAFCGNGVADFVAQDNDPTCESPACNIEKICKVMLENQAMDSIYQLAQVRWLQSLSGVQVLNSKKQILGTLLWLWQMCEEWGFFSTCEVGSKCMYSQGYITIDREVESICESYNITTVAEVERNVRNTNNQFGGRNIPTSRILWVNGGVDPWISQSIVELTEEQLMAGQILIHVPGASHHAWTHPSRNNDQLTVKLARMLIRNVVSTWIGRQPQPIKENADLALAMISGQQEHFFSRLTLIGSSHISNSISYRRGLFF